MKVTIAILTTLITLLLIYIFLLSQKDNSVQKIYKIDTIVKIVPHKQIKIIQAPSKIHYIKDTIILTQPFIATLDTIIQHDTVFAAFHFPENSISLDVRRQPDSLKIPQIILEPSSSQRNWFEIPAAMGVGLIIGLIIGK